MSITIDQTPREWRETVKVLTTPEDSRVVKTRGQMMAEQKKNLAEERIGQCRTCLVVVKLSPDDWVRRDSPRCLACGNKLRRCRGGTRLLGLNPRARGTDHRNVTKQTAGQPMTPGVCRRCQKEQSIGREAWRARAKPRCWSCGGNLDPITEESYGGSC